MALIVLQIMLLLTVAYILGCIAGCLLHQFFAEDTTSFSGDDAALMTADRFSRPVSQTQTLPPPVPAAPRPVERPVAPVIPRQPKRPDPVPSREPDDLKRIRGIGKKSEDRLNAVGITTYAQIAAWSKERQAEIGARLSFPGRIEREDWVGQARILAAGEQTEFSRRVVRGDVPTSQDSASSMQTGTKPKLLKKARKRKADDLARITGVGAALQTRLAEVGIFHFEQIAEWTTEEAAWIGNEIGFPGRVEREGWVAQARELLDGNSEVKNTPKPAEPENEN